MLLSWRMQKGLLNWPNMLGIRPIQNLIEFRLAPFPLTVFRSNSKFDQNLECCSLKYAQPIATKFCTRHESYTVIQIKICAEYRDMLPRPRLVCQEPGLRPIGRSPGVPDNSQHALLRCSWPIKTFSGI